MDVTVGNVVRIGDSVTCGDHAAQGSVNVFANGMPISTATANRTTGHGCFPASVFIGPFTSSVFVNSAAVVLQGQTKIQEHCCGKSCHDGVASSAAATVFFET